MAKTEILLDTGTNEIEIMVFTIYGESYGINVAKVREVMKAEKVKPMPHAHPSVEGIFKPRDLVITVVDLPMHLTGKPTVHAERDIFVITSFNRMNIAFRVESVVGIQRISWKDIQKPDKTLNRGDEGVVTGIAQCGNNMVTILDFESIVAEIAPETSINLDEIKALGKRERKDHKIILAEDSVLLAKMVEQALEQAGYTNLTHFNNGQEAWDFLQTIRNGENLKDYVDLIITDIEMPEMDGHRLTRLVKSDAVLKSIPLIIFSSLISPEMEIKGRQIGADEQLSKPEIGHLVTVMDELLSRSGQ
ncbi:MAG: chemotaxis protein CheV [Firmicutes bacterium]|nr:chemotaxis protein CheV [Bacillota bacterium]